MRDIKVAQRMCLLLIWPVILSLASLISDSWATSVFNEDFFVLFILGLVTFGLGLFFFSSESETKNKETNQFNVVLLVTGSVYAYALIWLGLTSGLKEQFNTAVMIALVIYTIIGLVTYFYGLVNNKRVFKVYGGLLVGCVMARLFFVDIWEMELAGKIVIFFLIGALLISTAFLSKKKERYKFTK